MDRIKHNEYNKAWAKRNRPIANRYHINWKAKRYEWYNNLKKGKKCFKCGESDPRCLDFHHKNPKDKIDIIRRFVLRGFKYELVLKEVGKCVLICSNCHRKEHN